MTSADARKTDDLNDENRPPAGHHRPPIPKLIAWHAYRDYYLPRKIHERQAFHEMGTEWRGESRNTAGIVTMTDVYAGDDDLRMPRDGSALPTFAYIVIADADPDVLLKVASHLMLANCAPARLTLHTTDGGSVVIEAEMRDISVQSAESIRRKLAQLSCAQSVAMSQSSP